MASPQPIRFRAPEAALVLGLALLLAVRFGPELLGRAGVPTHAPPLEIRTLDGDTVRLDELRGSVVLVNFWATWCAPCQAEMPVLQRVWETERDRGFLVLGLSTDTGPITDLVRTIRSGGITYPLARATPESERRLGHGGVLPTSLVIGRDGRIRGRVEGQLEEDELRRLVEPLLAEPMPSSP